MRIEVLVDVLDCLGGDSEAEPATWPNDNHAREEIAALPDDSEAAGDELDCSWPEWQSRGRHKLVLGQSEASGIIHEDAEEDDAPEEDDGDSAVDDRPCDDINMDLEEECDAEREQMVNDVPMLPVVSAEHNMFSDQRLSLGLSNLQSSFRTSSGGVRSADSGNVHSSKGWCNKPGTPV